MARIDDLIEANRRGLLTGKIKEDFDQAVARGLITLPAEAVAQPQVAPQDPRIPLQDLLIRQAQGEEGLQPQITQLREQLNIPDVDRDVSQFRPIQPEVPAGISPEAQRLEAAGKAFGIPGVGAGLESAERGIKQGFLTTGLGALGLGAKALGADEFAQQVELTRGIERQRTEQITAPAPIAGLIGEIGGGLVSVPVPAAQTARVAAALGATLGALSAEGLGENPLTGAAVGGALGGTLTKIGNVIQRAFQNKRAKLDTVKKLLEKESPDVRTLGFKLVQGENRIQKVPAITKAAKAAENQGFEKPTLSLIASASKGTKKKFNEMLDIATRSLRDKVFANNNRASDVLGNSFIKRMKVLLRAQKKTGNDIDRAAKSLEKLTIDPTTIEQRFAENLQNSGIKILGDKLDFVGSNIEGASGAEKALSLVFKRFSAIDRTKPAELHRFKRFIDNQVEFGKGAQTGLLREADNILKGVRRSVNEAIGDLSPVYRKANKNYEEIIGAINPFKDLTGKSINNLSDTAQQKAIGTLLRRELSNAQSRIPVLEARNTINDLARKFGGKFDDNLDQQIALVQDFENLGLSKAFTSLKGQVQSAFPPLTQEQAILAAARKATSFFRGEKSPEEAIKAIRRLIEASR